MYRATLFVKHGNSGTELASVPRGLAGVAPLILAHGASTAVVDCSVLDHARAATTHIATGWVDAATHRARDRQAWSLKPELEAGAGPSMLLLLLLLLPLALPLPLLLLPPLLLSPLLEAVLVGLIVSPRPALPPRVCHNCFVGGKNGQEDRRLWLGQT